MKNGLERIQIETRDGYQLSITNDKELLISQDSWLYIKNASWLKQIQEIFGVFLSLQTAGGKESQAWKEVLATPWSQSSEVITTAKLWTPACPTAATDTR